VRASSTLFLACGFLLLGFRSPDAAQAPVGSASAAIPIDREPRHRVVFTDERLRVLEVQIPAHDTTLNHSHDRDMVTVNVENGPTRTWSTPAGWSDVRTRDVGGVNVTEYTGNASSHIVQTMSDRAYRLTGVENLKAGGWTMHGPIGGPYLAIVAESRAFRAYEMRLPPLATVSHAHAVPVVLTLVDGAVNTGSGTAAMLAVSGQWSAVPAATAHTVEAGSAGARIIEIEVR
jgi:quercetin dioxygenase-like cupin family protein